MRAADYAALAARLDEVLHLGIGAAESLLPTEVKPATVASRLSDVWWGQPPPLPPTVKRTKAAKAAEPAQPMMRMTRFSFTMPGPIVATARPRVFRGGGIGLPLPSVLWRRAIQRAAIKAGALPVPSDEWCVIVEIATWQASRTAKPDVDNLAKGVLDALEGAGLFRDQRVTNLSVSKLSGPQALSVNVLW